MSKTILVTGATGTVGSQVVRQLSGRPEIAVRAAVRDMAKAPGLPSPVLFDFSKPETFAAALAGVSSVFLVAPVTPDGASQSQRFIAAARDAGIKHIVKLSVIASVGHITIGRWHSEIDEALKQTSIPWTILRPGGFMQNFAETAMPTPDGGLYAPVGNSLSNFIDTRDIAAVAAKVLTEAGHEGKEYTLTGTEQLTYSDVAAILSEVSGRTIRFVDIPESAAREGMLGAHMPEWLVTLILELYGWSRSGSAHEVTTTVSDILGRPAGTFRQFARDYASTWKIE